MYSSLHRISQSHQLVTLSQNYILPSIIPLLRKQQYTSCSIRKQSNYKQESLSSYLFKSDDQSSIKNNDKYLFYSTTAAANSGSHPNSFINQSINDQQQKQQTLKKIMTSEQQELVKKNNSLMNVIVKDLTDFESSESEKLPESIMSSLKTLKEVSEQLKDSLFLLVVVGEFNSGKSSFLNALLGNTYLKEGITPTTSKINIIKFGEQVQQKSQRSSVEGQEDYEMIQLPVNWLKDISLVDTPGTNAVIKGHQEITEHFIPKSDLILFVTSVDRAFSESEKTFLTQIRQWGKKIIVVLSKADLVEHNPMKVNPREELDQVIHFIQDNFNSQLGLTPSIFPVSAKQALKAKLSIGQQSQQQTELLNNSDWKNSKFSDLEQYILHTLDSSQRLKLKLLNPIGVAQNILNQFSKEMHSRSKVLSIDVQTVKYVNEQLDQFQVEMKKDFDYHLNRIENILLKMETRANLFIDDQIKLTNVFKLLTSNEIKLKFEKEVIGSTTHEIEVQISSLIDWIVEKNIKQWSTIMDYINQRSSSRLEKVIGKVNKSAGSGDFLYTRQNMLNGIGTNTTEALLKYDKEKESIKIISEIKTAVFQTAAIEVGVVGSMATLLTTSLLDLTGILGMGALAFGGLAVIPIKKSQLKKSIHLKVSDLRSQLNTIIQTEIENELEMGIQKIRDGISPYSSYIQFEEKKLQKYESKINDFNQQLSDLKDECENLNK
ncbi:hypothetical protein CYY_001543 [Polysphondylium violaceum]|uniref:Dynamin N-terminal domain-containing protein n=1 Tax=Polysphondylium violaceum TaxID=133409 RepID=A0A8J4V429_9MYCE|nr:hypothetical protein CYY_001543 [Polysphondylium violaceum]